MKLVFLFLIACCCAFWVDDADLRLKASNATAKPVPKYIINLDLPQKDRWTHIVNENKDKLKAATDYFNQFIPSWVQPMVFKVAKQFVKTFPDYEGEMQGIADASGIDIGEIITLQLVYIMEQPFNNCSASNTTGPGCKQNHIGACTSVATELADGTMAHGRNLDFNFPPALNELIVDIDYQTNNQTVFTGTTLIGFVGVLNGMVPGAYSISINARDEGGNVLENFATLLLQKVMLPSQLLRRTFEVAANYDKALDLLQNTKLANPVYYTAAGVNPGEGVVISRARLKTQDVWKLSDTSNGGKDWYKLQTNYDHWKAVPASDNRRDPGNAYVQALGKSGMTIDALKQQVMLKWPIFNPHTDWTSMMSAKMKYYETVAWFRNE